MILPVCQGRTPSAVCRLLLAEKTIIHQNRGVLPHVDVKALAQMAHPRFYFVPQENVGQTGRWASVSRLNCGVQRL